MALTIWKYPAGLGMLGRGLPLALQEGAGFRAFRVREERVELWFEVDTGRPVEQRTFVVTGTGHPIPDGCRWLATTFDRYYVWHLHEQVAG